MRFPASRVLCGCALGAALSGCQNGAAEHDGRALPDTTPARDAYTPSAPLDASTPAAESSTEDVLDAQSPFLSDTSDVPMADSSDAASTTSTAVNAQLKWALDTIAAAHVPTSDEVHERFSPEFLAEVSEAEVETAFASLAQQLNPFQVVTQTQLTERTISARLATQSGNWLVDIAVTATLPQQIRRLRFDPAPTADNYADAIQELSGLGAQTQLGISEITNGACTARVMHNPEVRLAIGSASKLWVLLALDQKIQSEPGLSWARELTIVDRLKSVPSGNLQNLPAGTMLTVREFAGKMISISDNTATDHLIDFVGPSAVEDALTSARHGAPSLNVPWFNTRELIGLKVWAPAATVSQFRAAGVVEKRALLSDVAALPIDYTRLSAWITPRSLDLEWFANSSDFCNVLATLASRSAFDVNSEIMTILALNSGLDVDPATWHFAGYKGGSEPGVLNMTWLLQRSDGRWFNVAITVNDSRATIAESRVFGVAQSILRILGAEAERGP